jgi:hypothetical protein
MIRSLLAFVLDTFKSKSQLIKQMANENPLWGAPHVHGEMLKLGYDISEVTVQRYMPKKTRRASGQRWKAFLQNHASQIVALDFFTVPTVSFRILYVLVFFSHGRRRLIHFNVTDHPNIRMDHTANKECLLQRRGTEISDHVLL